MATAVQMNKKHFNEFIKNYNAMFDTKMNLVEFFGEVHYAENYKKFKETPWFEWIKGYKPYDDMLSTFQKHYNYLKQNLDMNEAEYCNLMNKYLKELWSIMGKVFKQLALIIQNMK